MLLGDDDQPAGHTVEPMDNSRSEQPGPARLLIEMVLQRVTQRVRLQIAGRMHNLPRRLIDDYQPCILVNNVEWQSLRTMQLVRRLNQPHTHAIAFVDPRHNVNRGAVDLHVSRRHDPLQPPGRVIAKVPRQKRIDPHATQVALDD